MSLVPSPELACVGIGLIWDIDKLTGGTVSWISRATRVYGTLWAGIASGRIYIFKNADAADASTASENEVSNTLISTPTTPVRFVSGIAIDPNNPNHAWVSYGGYNSVAGSTTVPGHVFDVKWDGVSALATFTSLDGTGQGALGDLPINSLVRDDLTGDLYVATDFGVLRQDGGRPPAHGRLEGLPMVEVSSLAIDSSKRVMYAATHGRSAWRLQLTNPRGETKYSLTFNLSGLILWRNQPWGDGFWPSAFFCLLPVKVTRIQRKRILKPMKLFLGKL